MALELKVEDPWFWAIIRILRSACWQKTVPTTSSAAYKKIFTRVYQTLMPRMSSADCCRPWCCSMSCVFIYFFFFLWHIWPHFTTWLSQKKDNEMQVEKKSLRICHQASRQKVRETRPHTHETEKAVSLGLPVATGMLCLANDTYDQCVELQKCDSSILVTTLL